MNRIFNSAALFCCAAACVASLTLLHADEPTISQDEAAALEAELIANSRQITFEGRRAGEGYFSADGKQMVFQSERDPANPFYQIYLSDLETGDIQKVSPGHGKTTCAWIHPDGAKVLYASTQEDEEAVEKQKGELELRASGKQRRYAWDYDKTFDLFTKDLNTGEYVQLTDEVGYDAEASYSPDGEKIVFASNRSAYSRELSEREQRLFGVDKAYMIDLYIMNADGSEVRQLTDEPGYDGGPFFSADGQKICWRHFAEDGATAEIYTMNVDGSNVQRLTNINAMSWAPYFHPSGDYLIFTTNKHGFANFELYLVRTDGEGEPVRATFTEGFDGLPVFLPDGNRISWTSTRNAKKQSQIFMGDWNDSEARKRLGLDSGDRDAALAAAESSTPAFSPTDVMRHVDYLARPELGGRLTGTEGEKRATAYVAAYLESLGFEPAGRGGTFFQTFDFPAGCELTNENKLVLDGKELERGKDWRPLSFSGDGDFAGSEIVFAGYGMQVPAPDGNDDPLAVYDSYVHLDVTDKWVLVLRDMPQEITAERRQEMARYSAPRRKAAIARDLGARGIIFAAGPTSKVKRELIRFDSASQASVSIGVISVTNEIAAKMLAAADEDLAKIQAGLDDGSMAMGIPIESMKASATIKIKRRRGQGRNVIARLPAGDSASTQPVVIIGAHIDHLGTGGSSNSLAREDEQDLIHVGADDNASGVAAMLEIAHYLANAKSKGSLKPKRDLLVAAWSGEELGLFGSQAFAESFYELYPEAPKPGSTDEATGAHAHGASPDSKPLTRAVATYLNLDMVGRLRDKLVVQGLGSSPGFEAEVQRRNVPVGLQLSLDKTSSRLPTDASSFVGRGVPILSAFTGAHEDYHTPRDTPDKLNYDGAAKISQLFALIARGLLTSDQVPEFKLDEGETEEEVPRARLTAYLGTIPDYAAGEVKGQKLSGVAPKGPAAAAGVKGGDIITSLAGRKIENIYDYTYAIEALKIGEEVEIVVRRDDKDVTLKITPGTRE